MELVHHSQELVSSHQKLVFYQQELVLYSHSVSRCISGRQSPSREEEREERKTPSLSDAWCSPCWCKVDLTRRVEVVKSIL